MIVERRRGACRSPSKSKTKPCVSPTGAPESSLKDYRQPPGGEEPSEGSDPRVSFKVNVNGPSGAEVCVCREEVPDECSPVVQTACGEEVPTK